MDTRDDVTLEGDFFAASTVNRPGVLLLHMHPQNWDRTSWDADYLQRLQDRDWNLLVIDRRGAGGSGGEVDDSYREAGRNDAEAGLVFLRDRGAADLALISASNGTTTALDYTVWAATDSALPDPVAVAYLTGGTYTELQTSIESMPDIPVVFTYSTEEREWSVEQQALGRSSWVFHEYPDGAHGTKMFAADPSVIVDLDAFFVGVFGNR
jgi:pimeloyl-ACP methyl ester carboxylesterase